MSPLVGAARRFRIRRAGRRLRKRLRGRNGLVLLLVAVAVAIDLGVAAAAPPLGARLAASEHAARVEAQARAADDRAARGGTAGLQNPTVQHATTVATTATPVRVVIPTIDVDARLQRLAMASDGILEPPDNWTDAGWYAKGVVPGQVGAAVIAGHLDTTKRAAVFVALRFLQPGDPVTVEMSDGSDVRFTVTGKEVYGKKAFPTAAVYGPTPDSELRLITCNGPYSNAMGTYADNLVVFATKR